MSAPKHLCVDENVYETAPGVWVAEYIVECYAGTSEPQLNWERLQGAWGTREEAVSALIDARPS